MTDVTINITQGDETAGFIVPGEVLENLDIPDSFDVPTMRNTVKAALGDALRTFPISATNQMFNQELEKIQDTD